MLHALWLALLYLGWQQGRALGACPTQDGTCGTACQIEICSWLKAFRTATFNPSRPWRAQKGWEEADNRPCTDLVSSATDKAAYCDWYGITCCTNEERIANNCAITNTIVEIDLPFNSLNGSVNEGSLVGYLSRLSECGLRVLNLEANELSGTLDDSWGSLDTVEVLNLGNNWFTGTIPSGFQGLTKLKEFSLGNNFLDGPLPVWLGNLTSLEKLYLGANRGLTGTIPREISQLKNLTELSLQLDKLTGSLPNPLCLPDSKLTILSLRGNNLTGTVQQLAECKSLVVLDLETNQFSGPLPVGNWSSMLIYRMADNRFTGPIPDGLFDLEYLTELSLSNNSLTGAIPARVVLLRFLVDLLLQNNRLSGTIPDDVFYLPDLRKAVFSGNRDLKGEIPSTVRFAFSLRRLEMSRTRINGSIPNELANLTFLEKLDVSDTDMSCGSETECDRNQGLPCFLEFSRVTRVLAPGFSERNMVCQGMQRRNSTSSRPKLCDLGQIPPITHRQEFIINAEYYGYRGCSCLNKYQFQDSKGDPGAKTCVPAPPKFWTQHKLAGLVLGCLLAALLVGFLIGWTGKKKKYAYRLLRTMELNKRRQAGIPKAGLACVVVTDIEGYSDMMKVSPQLMTPAINMHNHVIRRALKENAGFVLEQEGDSYSVVFHDAFDAACFCLQVQQSLMKVDWPAGLAESGGNPLVQTPSSPSPAISASDSTTSIWRGYFASLVERKDQNGSRRGGREKARSAKSRFLSMFLRPSKEEGLFYGLRVRMGMATGHVEAGQDIKNGGLLDLGKMISDIGNGGQVLMCACTFQSLKDRLLELGAVNDKGMDYRLLADHHNRQTMVQCGCGAPEVSEQKLSEALVLDMGEYDLPALRPSPTMMLRSQEALGSSPPPVPTESSLHLWQILPPCLAGRALHWKNKLALKEGTRCLDPPFFSAPGAYYCNLGLPGSHASELPKVTMVFTMVEGGKKLVRRKEDVAREAHKILLRVLKQSLAALHEGYLCREQPGDLKYMVAFQSPEKAVEWCLLVQEGLLYQHWPESMLKMVDYVEEEVPGGGKWTFRGPRLKMGICEGPPRTIIPDHLGRADYHGTYINQSARYMDAAAHGGQVVCDQELAVRVCRIWRAEEPAIPLFIPTEDSQSDLSVVSSTVHGSSIGPSGNSDPALVFHSPNSSFTNGSATSKLFTDRPSSFTKSFLRGPGQMKNLGLSEGQGDQPTTSEAPPALEGPPVRHLPLRASESDAIMITIHESEERDGPGKDISRQQDVTGTEGRQDRAISPFACWAPTGGLAEAAEDLESRRVYVHHIGSFKFKGSPEAVPMVQVLLDSLVFRKFPKEAPKGKGGKVADEEGLVEEVAIKLPPLARQYRDEFYKGESRLPSNRMSLQKVVLRMMSMRKSLKVDAQKKGEDDKMDAASPGSSIYNRFSVPGPNNKGLGQSPRGRGKEQDDDEDDFRYFVERPVAVTPTKEAGAAESFKAAAGAVQEGGELGGDVELGRLRGGGTAASCEIEVYASSDDTATRDMGS